MYKYLEPIPLMVVTFDDGLMSDYEFAFPQLLARGVRGTSFVTRDWVGSNLYGNRGNMTWDNLREMKANGWDIQCHTTTHPHMDQISNEVAVNEINNVTLAFAENGLPTPRHHAYPFGDYDADTITVMANHRDSARKTGYLSTHINGYDTFQDYDYWGINADISDETHLQTLKGAIDLAVAENKIFVPYSHSLSNKTRQNNWLQMIDYGISKGIKFVTVSEMWNHLNAYREGYYKFV